MALDPVLLLQAFAAGVISFFAPCTVAMLPAYVGWFLGRDEEDAASSGGEGPHPGGQPDPDGPDGPGGPGRRPYVAAALAVPGAVILLAGLWDIFAINVGRSSLSVLQVLAVLGGTVLLAVGLRYLADRAVLRGIALGGTVSAGILAVFLAIGFPISLLLGSLLSIDQLYTAVLFVGGALIVLGVLVAAGLDLGVTIPWTAPKKRTATSFFAFGVGYGVVATGCNLPIFLLPISAALVQGGAIPGLAAFLAYGLGTAALMVALTVAMAAGRDVTGISRLTGPWVKRAMGILLALAGAYVIYYAWVLLATGAPPI